MGVGKKILLGVGIFVLVAVIAAFMVYRSLTGSSTVVAQINVESGSVMVNSLVASDGQKLGKGDVIETGADGQATVILYESVIVSLEPNSKITLDDLTQKHPQITQNNGETWNKFTKLSGVEEYSVKTGNSVASVRGTAFGIKGEDLVVGEGSVNYKENGEEFNANESEAIVFEGGKWIKRAVNAEEAARMKKRIERSIARMQHMRDLELKKNKFIVNRLKSAQGWSDNDIKNLLEEADKGNGNIDDLVNKSPVKFEGVQKIADITKKIRDERVRLDKLNVLK